MGRGVFLLRASFSEQLPYQIPAFLMMQMVLGSRGQDPLIFKESDYSVFLEGRRTMDGMTEMVKREHKFKHCITQRFNNCYVHSL